MSPTLFPPGKPTSAARRLSSPFMRRDSQIREGKKEYFVKWEGYPDSENTWEPSYNLDCAELMNAYGEAKKKQKENDVLIVSALEQQTLLERGNNDDGKSYEGDDDPNLFYSREASADVQCLP